MNEINKYRADRDIKHVLSNYKYQYRYIDIYNGVETNGYIYDMVINQYFIDDDETYIRIIDDE